MMTLIAIHSSLWYYIDDLVPIDMTRFIMIHNDDICIGLGLWKINLLLLHLLLMNLVRIGYILGNSLNWRVATDRFSRAQMLPFLYDSLIVKDNWLVVRL